MGMMNPLGMIGQQAKPAPSQTPTATPAPTPQATGKMSPEAFGQLIKSKYPQYSHIDDAQLASDVLLKHPQYRDKVDWSAAAPKGYAQQHFPSKPYVDPHPELTKVATGVVKAAPAIVGTVGATVGSLGGPAGSVVGAAEGGELGEAYTRHVMGQKPSLKAEAEQAALQGGLEYVGGTLAPKALEKLGDVAGPRATKIFSNYIGLGKGILPKMGRTAENAEDVAATALREAGVKGDLSAQRDAIEAARQAQDDQTHEILNSPINRIANKVANVRDVLTSRAKQLETLGAKEGWTAAQIRAVRNNAKDLESAIPDKNLTPSEIHAIRKNIQGQIKDWNPETTNVQQRLLQGVYHDLNDSIESTLLPSEAQKFRAANRIQNRLIYARNAVDKKLYGEQTAKTIGKLSRLARMGVGASAGGGVGSLVGAEWGHPKETAVAGAALGALGGAGISRDAFNDVTLPSGDIKIEQMLSRISPKLAEAAKVSPVAARAIIEYVKQRYGL